MRQERLGIETAMGRCTIVALREGGWGFGGTVLGGPGVGGRLEACLREVGLISIGSTHHRCPAGGDWDSEGRGWEVGGGRNVGWRWD